MKSIENVKGQITNEIERSKTDRREDRLPGLHHCMTVANSCQLLAAKATDKKRLDLSKQALHNDIAAVDTFLRDYSRRFGGEGSNGVDTSLKKLEVAHVVCRRSLGPSGAEFDFVASVAGFAAGLSGGRHVPLLMWRCVC